MGEPIYRLHESRWPHIRNASGISYPCFTKIVLYSLLYLNISTILSVGRPCFQKTTLALSRRDRPGGGGFLEIGPSFTQTYIEKYGIIKNTNDINSQ